MNRQLPAVPLTSSCSITVPLGSSPTFASS
uniref:Uncharacterized protein n=1 Tax=Arundo donax TaxID=35708 RepID=A0A0A9TAQ9_ARUDO